jgi:hypothetical protein
MHDQLVSKQYFAPSTFDAVCVDERGGERGRKKEVDREAERYREGWKGIGTDREIEREIKK